MPLRGRGIDKVLQISNQVWQLRHFNVSLDHITWIQVPDCLNELLESIIILFLFIKIICVLLRNLSNDLAREVGSPGYVLSLREQSLLQQSLDFYIVLHFIKLEELLLDPTSLPWLGSQYINGIILNLNKEDLRERLTIDSQTVLKVINRYLHASLKLFKLHDLLVAEESELVFLAFQDINRDQISILVSSDRELGVFALFQLCLHGINKKHP